ncbi:MAG: gas vesicle protein [Candidatus Micrarchaeota archaeon]
MAIRTRQHEGVPQILDRLLDRGIVINARIRSYLFDFKLVELESLVLLSSFETAYKLGVGFPKDVNLQARGWRELILKEPCPQCGKGSSREELFLGCPWCGYKLGG